MRASRFVTPLVQVLIGVAFLSGAAAGQTSTLDSARALEAEALAARRNAATVEAKRHARTMFSTAAELYRRANDPRGQGETLHQVASILAELGYVDSATTFARRAADIRRLATDRRGEAISLHNLAGYEYRLGHRDSAVVIWHRALGVFRALEYRRGEIAVLYSLGELFQDAGELDSAVAYMAPAIPAARASGERAFEARFLVGIGYLYRNLGRRDSALVLLSEGATVALATNNRGQYAWALTNRGLLLRELGRPDTALVDCAAGTTIQRELGDRTGEAQGWYCSGNVYRDLAQPESALVALHRARSIWTDVGNRRWRADADADIGMTQMSVGRADSALHYLKLALQTQRDVADRRGEAESLLNLGRAYTELGRSDSALLFLDKALDIARASRFRPLEGQALHRTALALVRSGGIDSARTLLRGGLALSRDANDPFGELAVLQTLARVEHGSTNLVLATSYFDSAAALRARITATARTDESRMGIAEGAGSLHGEWALAWLDRRREIGEARAALAGLAAAERGRAQALRELMQTALNTVRSEGRPSYAGEDVLVREGERLRDVVRSSRTVVLYYQVTPDVLVRWLLLPTGEVLVGRESITSDSLTATIAATTQESSAAGARALAGPSLEPIPTTDGTARGIGISSRSTAAARARETLARVLVPPDIVRRIGSISEWVIIPDGQLHVVAFAALPVRSAREPLGLNVALRYAPSLEVLGVAQQSARPSRRVAFVVGDPMMPAIAGAFGARRPLPPLPGSALEAAIVAKMLETTALTGAAANETDVRWHLATATIAHFATHGFSFSTHSRSRDSFIALAPAGNNDGLLTVGEVLDQLPQLSAELVVLSACQTGRGGLRIGEGTLGFQRAFLAKGARSVLVSLWSVDDEATRMLMERFYTHWLTARDRPSKAEALRRAQADVRRTQRFEDPRYWAGFQLVGA